MSATEIRAAGGLLRRTGPDGREQVAVVHRPRYDDWSLPKGKLDGHEDPLLAAVREVGEETGRQVAVGRRLATVRYDVGNQAKAVQYWAMTDAGPLGDGDVLDVDEVSEVAWHDLDEVRGRLSYDDDRTVVEAHARTPHTTAVVVLVRHARAGKRSEWDGDDRWRPLDDRGRAQAAALAGLVGSLRPTAVFAADRVRCEQTVAPLAAAHGLAVQTLPEVSDEAFLDDPGAAVDAVARVSTRSPVTVICSQGTALPGLLDDWLPPRVRTAVPSLETRKAAWWAVGTRSGVPVWIDRYDRPSLHAATS